MTRWTDLATWRGPTVNQSGPMAEHRGVVLHIAEGSYEGTISWQRNPAAQVSSHFIVAQSGQVAQMVDTDTTAWTQIAGNGYWLSVENEGHTPGALTAAQVEANAQLLARAHRQYGIALRVTASPTGQGLGHHSMGGTAWGHLDCPGPAIIAQKAAIVARASQIANGGNQDMSLTPAQDTALSIAWEVAAALRDGKDITEARHDPVWLVKQSKALAADVAALKTQVAALAGKDLVDEAEVARQVLAALTPAAIANAVVTALPAELAAQVVTELSARLAGHTPAA